MENKYFTPKIEDLRIGYKCEINTISCQPIIINLSEDLPPEKIGDETNVWKKIIINDNNINASICILKEMKLRTPFLTKEQIEGEGWIYKNYLKDGGTSIFIKDNYELYFYRTNNNSTSEISISLRSEQTMKTTLVPPIITLNYLFQGTCKSINEFRYIMKLLNIK